MAVEIVMPKLGWTMEEGILVEWLKQDGDVVQPGDILFTVESDKALNEVESFEAGILRIPPDSKALGTPLPVGTLLAYIVQPGETPPFETVVMTAPPGAGGEPPVHPAATPSSSEPVSHTRPHAATSGELPTISPRARRAAAELGVEWELLTGSGRTGRIVERDVRAAASSVSASNAIETPLAHPRQPHIDDITARVQSSMSISVTTEADATELYRLHQRIQAAWWSVQQSAPTRDDLLIRLVAEALKQHPQVNARLEDGTFGIIHLGLYEIDAFAPALGESQTVILGVGRVVAKQVVIDVEQEHVAIRHMMFLSLTCDSQVISITSAARFLHLIKQYLEQPVLWLVNLAKESLQ